jgi:flagellar basal-body rod protein FlgG
MDDDDPDVLAGGAIILGQITLYRFINPESLDHIGGNLLVTSAASGPPVAGTPGEDGFGRLEDGYLERSNVDLAEQMTNLIRGQRALQSSSRTLVTADELWGLTINIIQG